MKTDWITLLESATAKQEDPIPAGYKTTREIAKETGIGFDHTRLKLRLLLKAGAVERRCFRRKNGRGLSMVPYYRILKPSIPAR